jgi:molybdopterin-guanine dinucleotide biosynthesis protein A
LITPFDAVVLAGGAATRLDGVDKMLVEVGGVRLLDRAVAAVAGAERVIVVGDPRPGVRDVRWAREQPAGGGPVAALAAGLTLVESPRIVLLAADLPFVARRHVAALLDALDAAPERDGAMFVDPGGRDQLLLSGWRTGRLRAELPVEPAGAALRRVLAPLAVQRLPGENDLLDCDTPADVDAARRLAREEGPP